VYFHRPTTFADSIVALAAYIICVSVAGPALMKLGLKALQVHFFVFWFALLSTITPPVCGAVFIAAGMVGEQWLKAAISAMALGVGLYVVPLGNLSHPSLIPWRNYPLDAAISMAQMIARFAILSFPLIAPQLVWRRIFGLTVGLIVALY